MDVYVNGNALNVPEELQAETLLDFLRDFAGLKGTKFGCGMGLCGACTVHIGTEAVRACQVSVAEAADKQVTTIEGLADSSDPEEMHPLQRAWIDNAVPQCGYCQPGQIMAASALLKRNPSPTDAEIQKEMSGNLCRCGTYGRIRKAIALVVLESAG